MSDRSNSKEVSPRKTYRVMAGTAIAMMVLLGLAIYSFSRMESTPWRSSLRAPDIHSSFRKNLPQFEHQDPTKSLTEAQFEGKWTLLSFWSYGCPPCLEEMPALNQMGQTWPGAQQLQILTVNVDPEESENLEFAKAFLAEIEFSQPTYFDGKGQIATAFAVEEYPKHFLVNPKKEIVWEAIGAFKWNEASTRDQLLKLIEQPAPEIVPDPAE